MHFVAEFVIGILTVYLALTNSVADYILDVTTPDDEVASATPTNKSESFSKLSSAYQAIPNILLQNAAFQNASIVESSSAFTSASPIEALVNIFCTYTTDEYARSTTGTGYFIDRDGIVLTNAHVAQFLLLEGIEGSTECFIRTGNPAVATYKADLLYISPAWVQKHAKLIMEESPQGTGERDYALLYIHSGINNKPMPKHFPSLSIDTELMRTTDIDKSVIAAGYPAQTIFAQGGADSDLIPRQATTSIVELMTFGSNYADLFTIAGSDIGEQGSSGGPIVDTDGNAVGIISTRGDDVTFGEGSLRALTLSYIDRTITEETGFNLPRNLSGDLPYRSKIFKETLVPFLRGMLERELVE